MKNALRFTQTTLIVLQALMYVFLNNVPYAERNKLYAVVVVTNIFLLYGLMMLFALLELTNYFGLLKHKNNNGRCPLNNSKCYSTGICQHPDSCLKK